MKHFKFLILILFIFSALFSETLKKSEINPEYIKYMNDLKNNRIKNVTESGYSLGYIPPPVMLNTELKSNIFRKTVVFDSRYDLRDYNFVTSAKNQASCGACWTFATMGSVESNWLKLGFGTNDLSENNMKNGHNYEWASCDGGNPYISTSYFTKGAGPITEIDDPYVDYEDGYTSGLTPVAYIGEARYFPNDSDVLKQAILDNGALYTNMRWEDQYYNSTNNTYYCSAPIDSSTNHGVLLVGWDDTKVTDGGTGAWIIKNSWGTGWGENGFFYISYNDTKVNGVTACWPNKYEYTEDTKIGQYDEFGWVNNWGYGDGLDYGLMKYTPENETISMIGTWAVAANSVLKVEIYDDFNGTTLSNKLGESNNQTCDFAGYYNIPLNSPITVSANDDIYIKVMYNTGTSYPIPAEQLSEGYAEPTIDYGRHWISNSGTSWLSSDDYDFDINIKVYSNYVTETVDANFYASTTSGNAPLTVNFTDQSTGLPTSWNWNFGDGYTSNSQNPTHIYSSGGTYSVSLSVGNGSSTNSEIKTNYITVTGGSAITSTTAGGKWSEPATWVGGVVPGAGDNVIINGTVRVNGSLSCNNISINNGKILQNDGYNYTLSVQGNIINNGIIRNHESGWSFTIYIAGNFMNNGSVEISSIYFNGNSDQTITMATSASFTNINMYNSNHESAMIAGSDLTFTNVVWDSNDEGLFGEFVLPAGSGYELVFSAGYINKTKIVANNNSISSINGHYYNADITISDGILKNTIISNSNSFWVTGNTVIEDTLQSSAYYYAFKVDGNLTNNGTITNSPSGWGLYLHINGNLVNNGIIQCQNLYLNGTNNQTITFDSDAEFQNINIYNENSTNKIVAGSDLTFINTIINFNDDGSQGEIVLPSNSGYDLFFTGGYVTDTKITANGNSITSTEAHYFYSNITISDAIFKGTTISNSNSITAVGEIVIDGIFQSAGYYYTLKVEGNLTNNGTIQDNPSGWSLDLYVDGNLTNNGNIANENIFFNGTSDQTVSMGNNAIFSDNYIYNQYSTSKVIAGSDLTFTNVIMNFNDAGSQGEIELPASSKFDLKFIGGYITDTKISAHNNGIYFEKGTYFYTNVHVYDPVFNGRIRSNSNSFYAYGTIVNQDTLETRGYYYSLKVDGELTNNGVIRNDDSGWGFTLDIDGDLKNNGVISNSAVNLLSSNNQNIYLVNGNKIDAPVNLKSNKGSSTFQWYRDASTIDGAVYNTYTFQPLNANHYGTYYCSTNEGNSQTFTISGANVVVVPDIMTANYGPPEVAGTWTKYSIPMTYESFGVTAEVFNEAMKQISMIRIRTEMADGTDFGSVDNVKMSDVYSANFTSGTEGWTVMGDGTMSWVATGGVEGGYISIADWASGDWHWAVAPTSWTGDISSLIGDNFEFYFRTDRPDYAAVVEFHTGDANRIVLTANKMNLVPGESTVVSVALNPIPGTSTVVSLSSSNTSYITVPNTVTVPAGVSLVTFTVSAAESISSDGTSVVSASTSGYSTARLTFSVSESNNTTLSGKVTDATTGQPIQGALVQLAGISSTSDADGNYLLQNVPAGALTAEFVGTPTSGNAPLNVQFADYSTANTQTVKSTLEGYIDYENRQVQIIEDQSNTLDISMSPTLMEGAIRFVLSWDNDPRDLDSYLHTPEIDGEDYYIYYSNKGNSDSPPYAILDVDDTDGYGPETITIHQTYQGMYKYYIHKYNGNQLLSQSNAVVHIYDESGQIHTIHVPSSGTGTYWEVCELDGQSKNITIINQIRDESPSTMTGKLLAAAPKIPMLRESSTLAMSWEWNFGDGETSSEQNPQHLYTSGGYYTVTLKVTDGDNNSTEIKENYIYVEEIVTTVDTLLWESFEENISGWIVYDNDGDGNKWATFSEEAPYDTVAHSGARGLGVIWNSSGNDDWIVTPPIYIPENGDIEFSVWAHSHSSTYPEDFNVKLSTVGSALSDFTTTLQEVRSAPLAWTDYIYDLNSYKGQTIYLAVQCVSVDKYYLWLDDFLVTSVSITDIDDDLEIIPESFALHQNYPNPFNPSTNISYDLPVGNKVDLSIYNIRGELVEQLVSQHQNAGQHKTIWHADNQPTGIYFMKLTAGNSVAVKKIMFMK